MIKKLNYVIPPVVSYFRHSYPLGIMCANGNAQDWIVSNYMTLCWPENQYAQFDMLVSYNDNPFLKLRTISKDELAFFLSRNSFDSIVKVMIDLELYIQVNNDDYYLSSSRLYESKHHLHQILITGYDDKKKVYYCWTFVNGIYKEIEVPFSEIVVYQGQESYGTNTVMILYSKRGGGFSLDIDEIFVQIRDYLEAKKIANIIAPWGCFEQYKDAWFGIECYRRLHKEMDKQFQNSYFDHRFLCVLSEHKKMLLERIKYLHNNGFILFVSNQDIDMLELVFRYSEVAINNVLKLNMCKKEEKRKQYYEKIIETINLVEETEKEVLSSLLNKYEMNEKSNPPAMHR